MVFTAIQGTYFFHPEYKKLAIEILPFRIEIIRNSGMRKILAFTLGLTPLFGTDVQAQNQQITNSPSGGDEIRCLLFRVRSMGLIKSLLYGY